MGTWNVDFCYNIWWIKNYYISLIHSMFHINVSISLIVYYLIRLITPICRTFLISLLMKRIFFFISLSLKFIRIITAIYLHYHSLSFKCICIIIAIYLRYHFIITKIYFHYHFNLFAWLIFCRQTILLVITYIFIFTYCGNIGRALGTNFVYSYAFFLDSFYKVNEGSGKGEA